MAKKKRRNPPKTTWNRIMQSIPSEAHFTITMDGDSTNEVMTDIDTNIGDGEAWLVYGCEYWFETITPTVPLATFIANTNWNFQLHRNDDNALLLNFNDDDVLLYHQWMGQITASGGIFHEGVFRVMKRTITMQPTLRALFRTQSDNTTLSATTNQLAGKLYYDKIPAPDIGASKLGRISQL
jgi:hypothetical protein